MVHMERVLSIDEGDRPRVMVDCEFVWVALQELSKGHTQARESFLVVWDPYHTLSIVGIPQLFQSLNHSLTLRACARRRMLLADHQIHIRRCTRRVP